MTERFPDDPKTATLAAAKDWLRERVRKGAPCPCCAQYARVYERQITGAMAVALVIIERYFRTHTDWLHTPTYLTEHCPVGVTIRGGDYTKLVHWGLLEEKPEIRDDGSRRAGYYKITPAGVDFARGATRVPKYVAIYNMQPVLSKKDVSTVSIYDVLGRSKFKNFDYGELMR
jgi:hypothetical protein